jgi:drug/metabolite transporter (DMT)-like permease
MTIATAARPTVSRIDWPTAAGFMAIVLWALFPLTAHFIHGVPPLQLSAIGFAIASCAGLCFLTVQKRLHELKQRPIVWLHGVGGIFGFNALIFAAMALAPPTQAVAINYSWPLFTVLLSAVVLKIKLKWPHWLGLSLGFCGCLLLALKGERSGFSLQYWHGYACALTSSLVWATYSAFSNKLGNVPSGALAGFYAVTAVLSAICSLCFEHPFMPDPRSCIALLALGIGPMGMAYFLWDYGIKRGSPVFLGALSYVCPALSYLFLAIPGFAPIGLASILAMVLMLAGGGVAAQGKSS